MYKKITKNVAANKRKASFLIHHVFFLLSNMYLGFFSIAAEYKECFSPTLSLLYNQKPILKGSYTVGHVMNSILSSRIGFEESSPACSDLSIFIYKVYIDLVTTSFLSCVGTLIETLQH